MADDRIDFERGISVAPPVTIFLIIANTAVFVMELARGSLLSEQAIIDAGALAREHVIMGEWWRLGSAMFLHGGFEHLFGNCIALYILGMASEHAWGRAQTALIYLAGGLAASLISVVANPGPSVGASGAVFALMGTVLVFFYRYGPYFHVRDKRIGTVLLVWAIYSFGMGIMQPYIDNAAHFGGVIAGAALALAAKPRIFES
jgi:rhomboid protease GluP